MKFLICFVMLVSAAAAAVLLDMSGKAFNFPEETNTANVRLTPAHVTIQSLTVCHRSLTDLKRDHSLFSLSSPSHHNEFLIFMNWGSQEIQPYIQNRFARYGDLDYAPNKWHSICTTWDSLTGLVQMWFNGDLFVKKYISETPFNEDPIIILGQEQDSHGGRFDARQSFVGMMCDVHVWNYVLSSCEIQKYMKEKNFTPGNVVNWRMLDYTITGRVMIENKNQTCNSDHSVTNCGCHKSVSVV